MIEKLAFFLPKTETFYLWPRNPLVGISPPNKQAKIPRSCKFKFSHCKTLVIYQKKKKKFHQQGTRRPVHTLVSYAIMQRNEEGLWVLTTQAFLSRHQLIKAGDLLCIGKNKYQHTDTSIFLFLERFKKKKKKSQLQRRKLGKLGQVKETSVGSMDRTHRHETGKGAQK